jgi:hypothetical protein
MAAKPIEVTENLTRLVQGWPALIGEAGPPPFFDWEAWSEALLAFTHHRTHEMLVRGSLATIVRQAHSKPPYLVLEDLLIVAIAAHNQAWDFPMIKDEESRMP